MNKAYLSNIAKAWPIGDQEQRLAGGVPDWPDVGVYRDVLPPAKRRGQSREAMKERASLLRPVGRPRDETIYVASWPALAWDTRDLMACFAAAAARGATLIALDTGMAIGPKAGPQEIDKALNEFVAKKRSADAGGGPKVGAAASVKARAADIERRIALIRDDWPKPWPPTSELLLRAGRERKIGRKTVVIPMAYSTACKALKISRPKAQVAFQASLARAEANRRRRKRGESTDEG